MLRYIQDEELPYRVTLIYSNRDRDSTAFLDELEEMERTNPNIRLIVTMTEDDSWPGESRRIDADFFEEYLGDGSNEARYMVAGPARIRRSSNKGTAEGGRRRPADFDRQLQRILNAAELRSQWCEVVAR